MTNKHVKKCSAGIGKHINKNVNCDELATTTEAWLKLHRLTTKCW